MWPSLLGFVNKGVCGDTTRLALERFTEDVRLQKPDRVLVQFGFNDCNRWATEGNCNRVSLEAFDANLREIIYRCRMLGSQVFLLGMFSTSKGSVYESDRRDYEFASHHVARDTATPYISLRDAIRGVHLLSDGLHLNPAGHEAYAERIKAWL